MPPKKQPSRLADLAVQRVANIAEDACNDIETVHGKFHNPSCRKQVSVLRSYFLENIGHAFEELCSRIVSYKLTFAFPTDPRILVNFLLHENTETVKLPLFGGMRDFSSYLTSRFWAQQFSTMKKITSLDISEIRCTDEIIRTVSDTCAHLKRLEISNSSDGLTDDGLLQLVKCSHLAVLLDFEQFGKFAQSTLRDIVKSLPKLVVFNYLHMGQLLSKGFDDVSLQLRHLAEHNVDNEHVKTFTRVCPNLEQLSLRNQTLEDDDDVLRRLASSNWRLLCLELIYFSCARVIPMLREKGKHIYSLQLTYSLECCTSSDIILIGLTCPALRHFSWVSSGSCLTLGQTQVAHSTFAKEEERAIFSCLESLKLNIKAYDFDRGIAQICLKNAENIKGVLIIINDVTDTDIGLYAMLTEVLNVNKMTSLIRLRISSPSYVCSSLSAVELIFHRLINLKQLWFFAKLSADVANFFTGLEMTIFEQQLSLRLVWRNLSEVATQNFVPQLGAIVEVGGEEENELEG